MACEITSQPPFHEMGPQENFSPPGHADMDLDFDKLVQYNTKNFIANNSLHPQNLSNPTSPSHNHNQHDNISSIYNAVDFSATTSSPYYHSIETPPTNNSHDPYNQPFALHHEFRRSISEPPGNFPAPQAYQHGNVVLHRDGHCLGTPRSLKSLPKARQNVRAQPYPQAAGGAKARAGGVRYQLRRTQTQPLGPSMYGQGQTSVPVGLTMSRQDVVNHPYPPALMQQNMHSPELMAQQNLQIVGHTSQPRNLFAPMPTLAEQPRSMISSRVCTPTPEDFRSQPVIDPALMAPITPGPMAVHKQQATTLQMTPGELRMMITEAVQKAFSGLNGGRQGACGMTQESVTVNGGVATDSSFSAVTTSVDGQTSTSTSPDQSQEHSASLDRVASSVGQDKDQLDATSWVMPDTVHNLDLGAECEDTVQ
ncbi:hypothetical protein LTR62_000088 [Meristemomyces frigidus]|uniref:Uncharacterized protein n=1 Tax=Meristemomyces frigidus TaxID=1508187 RepID=A0AAN7TQZ8_9PEZI|nr:hypothetical protein LTR62_000088 [Meristemomyces frigidus]